MGIFDHPRINVQGTIRLNPATANNDDYAASATLPKEWNALAGEPLGLIDSKNVKARTYGLSDADFLRWVQKARPFDVSGQTQEIIPAEWNYYGDMSSSDLSIRVVGTQAGDSGVDLAPCEGAVLSMSGSITDINPEGSPPATQFFIENLDLAKNGVNLIHAAFSEDDVGGISKGVGQWINFFRNVNLRADAGAGTYVYHVLRGAQVHLPGWKELQADGLIFRYYLSRALLVDPETGGSNAGIEKLYEEQKDNPKDLELVGTFAPYRADETIAVAPTGRLMTWDVPNVETPTSNNNGGGKVALGPAVVHREGRLLTADFSGTFPDQYDEASGANPKFDFGPVSLVAVDAGETTVLGSVPYADTEAGNACGWLFELELSEEAEKLLSGPDAALKLVSREFGDVLAEVDYYFVSNQQALYAEEQGNGESFFDNGSEEEATVAVFHRGEELGAEDCPPITVWQYRSVPLQSPGDAIPIATDFEPGQPLSVDTDEPGNRLLTFTIGGGGGPVPAEYPPKSYSEFMNPPYVTNWPQISIRILPNEDYDRYYVDPTSDEPVGNEHLTFELVYREVLQVYYLLYPVMSFLPLNSEKAVAGHAEKIIEATSPKKWMSTQYMPRTRDLSESRRRLLQAWCRKAMGARRE